MPTIHFGKRAGRTRGRPEDRATADGLVSISVLSSGTDEVDDAQVITLVNGYGGDFTLTDGTDTTSAIAWNASASTVKTRIEADFASVTSATVTGSAGGPWTIALGDNLGPIDDYVGAAAGLTVRSVVITEAVKGVANTYQVTSVFSDADTGTFLFTFGGEDSAATAYDAIDSTVDTNFTGITGVTSVGVTGAGSSGTPWEITFADPAGDAGAVTITNVDATKAGSTTIATTQQGADNVYEIVEIYNAALTGTFSLLFDGQETDQIPHDGDAAVVESELEELSTIADVAVTGNGTVGQPWIVTFADPAGNVAAIFADDTNLGGGTPTTTISVDQAGVDLVNEIQTVHRGDADGGTFTITHAAQTTAALAWDISAADLKTALELIASIADVAVTGTGSSGDPWTIAFTDPSGVEAEITTSDSLTITATFTVADDTPGVDAVNEQQLVTVNNGTGGTYKLTYDTQEFGSGFAFDGTAAELETALELLANISAATVTGDDGGPYTVEFVTPGSADLGMMTADVTSLTGAAASVTVLGTVAGVVNVNETQLFVVNGDTGTYVLTHDSNDTSALAAAANAATIKTALELLASITTVTVTGAGSRKNPFKVAFTAPEGDTSRLTATVTSLSNTVVVAARAQGASDDRE